MHKFSIYIFYNISHLILKNTFKQYGNEELVTLAAARHIYMHSCTRSSLLIIMKEVYIHNKTFSQLICIMHMLIWP